MKKTFTVSQNSTQEPIDSHEHNTNIADLRNIIVAQEADEKYEQTTRIPGIIGMNIRGCIVPCAWFFAVACDGDMPNKGEELPLPPLLRTVRDTFMSYGSSISQPGSRAAIGKDSFLTTAFAIRVCNLLT